MSKAENKNQTENNKDIENILDDIKDAINSEDEATSEDVLELTDLVDDEFVESVKKAQKQEEQKPASKSEDSDKKASADEKKDEPKQKSDLKEQTETNKDESKAQSMKENKTKQTPAPKKSTKKKVSSIKSSEDVDILQTLDNASKKDSSSGQTEAEAQFQSFEKVKNSDSGLISKEVIEASRNKLQGIIKMNNKSSSDVESLKLRSGVAVEDLIIEMIKPQISEWLNKNLPALVEKVVEKEIKKLIPKE